MTAPALHRRVLVFPCGSEVGLEIHRSLCHAKEVELFGASSVPDHGRFVYRNYRGDVPFIESPRFLDAFNGVVSEHSIDYVFPAHDSVVLRLAEAAHHGEVGCHVLTSSFETCLICRSKSRTLTRLRSLVRVPKVYSGVDQVPSWPVFVKPDVGQGSRGANLVTSPDMCRELLAGHPSLLILEHLPGPEYTVDCLTARDGRLVFSGVRERLRITNGISVCTRPVDVPELVEMARVINDALRLRGVWFFQAKADSNGELALLEVAPRVAGSMGLFRIAGANLPLMALYDAEGFDVQALTNKIGIELDRALSSNVHLEFTFHKVFVDLDDCLIIKGKVNAELMRFLYECRNRGMSIHLLTRHEGDPWATLRSFCVSEVFDSVKHLRAGEAKSDFIDTCDSIMIDDSFSERLEVSRRLGIPVFSPDAVSGLTDAHLCEAVNG